MTATELRDYKPEDFDELFELWQATGLASKGRGDDANVIANTLFAGGKLFILSCNDKIIGSSWITNDGRRLYLHHLCVAPDFQGKKLSHVLLKASLKYAHKLNMQIKLEVSRKNEFIINLYEKYGFKYLGDYDVYIIRNLSSICF
ncbi:MAG: GNAT family N-acetyltransferase [Candidatus Rifleibacteriota bacterium]